MYSSECPASSLMDLTAPNCSNNNNNNNNNNNDDIHITSEVLAAGHVTVTCKHDKKGMSLAAI